MKITADLLDLYKIKITDNYGDSVDYIGTVYATTLEQAIELALRLIYAKSWEVNAVFYVYKASAISYDGKYYDVSEEEISRSSAEYIEASLKSKGLDDELRAEQKARIKKEFELRALKIKKQEAQEKALSKKNKEIYERGEYERLKKKYGPEK